MRWPYVVDLAADHVVVEQALPGSGTVQAMQSYWENEVAVDHDSIFAK